MTEQKTVQLNANEWKAICLQDVRDLYQFLDSMAYPTDQAISQIDQHMARWAVLMRSWKLHGEPKKQAEGNSGPEAKEAQPNGAGKTKRKGGWPKGKSRKPKAEAEATAH